MSNIDHIVSQLDPTLQGLIGEAAAPPPGSSAPDDSVVLPSFDLPPPVERGPTKREQTSATKDAERQTQSRVSPALKSMGYLAKLLPGAERVRLYKKNAYGQLAFICDLSARDIETSGDLETHINRHIVPIHKGGEYVPIAIDGRGNSKEVAAIFIAEAPAVVPGSTPDAALGLVREMMHKMEKQMNQPPPDPIEQMMKMQAALRQMKELSGQKEGGTDPMAMFMMMQMMQSQSRPSGPDPMLIALIDKMDSRMAQLEKKLTESANAAPMPMLPPPTDPLEVVAKILPLIQPKEDPDKLSLRDVLDLVKERQPAPSEDRPSWRDIIDLMKEQRHAEKPAQTVMEQIQAVAAAKQALEALSPPQQGGNQTTFWDALGALFSQEKFGAGIGAAIAGSVQAKQARQLPAPAQVHQLPPRAPAQAAPAPAGALAPQAGPPARPQIMMPEQIKGFCDTLNMQLRDDERIDQTVQMLWMLSSTPQWQPFVMEILRGVTQDKKAEVLQGMQGFFALLTKNELLSVPAAHSTLRAFDEHWVEVQQGVVRELQKAGMLPKDAGAPVVTPPPASTPAPAPVAETVSESAEASDDDSGDDEDEQEGEAPAIVDLPPDLLAEMGGGL